MTYFAINVNDKLPNDKISVLEFSKYQTFYKEYGGIFGLILIVYHFINRFSVSLK